ncbi:MAG: pyrimidine/purine nucleoside phosphorylase [Desulfuromonadales bacterium]|nr:pyrimidine/purine nucleoside phosphorylase [Desulfuromonadales bacterium]
MSEQFHNVTVTAKANIFFDGKVVSHTILLADNSRKTLGLIYPGDYKFNVNTAEKMEIIAGSGRVRIGAEGDWQEYPVGSTFDVPAGSFFEISVAGGMVEYICSFA